ncbi:MAG: GNAT family N-acetyltransferase [Mesorhizobium sp.]|nr:MAG: GNAT family N-acetyltransferase [Mesorhizobium sp.]TGT83482.1 GNAT family N-acetyltransferase [Mesorhizobium sp. M8A.F.Ca.ET.161.01.1.1]TGV37722.1 GNAT family N-acetyltransferase [Mesorhizobium sp. M8A.F.Ca.ET.142.01.1.1]RWB10719.1 MAG: GNAT family N-acetyltransferase [Mesorhizobium sp.]TIQ75786.1 MAG: GNAT family N-acetyltransferase [Mesorhizobium sp.]
MITLAQLALDVSRTELPGTSSSATTTPSQAERSYNTRRSRAARLAGRWQLSQAVNLSGRTPRALEPILSRSPPLMEIRLAGTADRDAWRSLWYAYCADQGLNSSEQATDRIWRRIERPDEPINALIAVSATGVTIGFATFVIHPYTLSDRPVCFLADLYVDESSRRQGIGQAMLTNLASYGRDQGWLRIYWNTDRSNYHARALYDKIGKLSPYLTYYFDL